MGNRSGFPKPCADFRDSQIKHTPSAKNGVDGSERDAILQQVDNNLKRREPQFFSFYVQKEYIIW